MMDRVDCPKHLEFFSKNKFEILVHPAGFIVRIYFTTVTVSWEQAVRVSPEQALLGTLFAACRHVLPSRYRLLFSFPVKTIEVMEFLLTLTVFILQSVLRHAHTLFQSEFSIHSDLVLPLSTSSRVLLKCDGTRWRTGGEVGEWSG